MGYKRLWFQLKCLTLHKYRIAQAKAPVAVVVRQADQPVCCERVLGILLGLVAVTELADGEHCAGDPYGLLTPMHNLFVHLAPARRLSYFFARYSLAVFALGFCEVHLLEPPVLVFELFPAEHH